MSLLEQRPYSPTHLDRAPAEAGLPFEPGLGDKIMFEQGHVPDQVRDVGRLAVGAPENVEHTVIEVWPAKRS